MLKMNFRVWTLSIFLGGSVFPGVVADSSAGVNVNIGAPGVNISIGAPPPLVVKSPPPMAVVPGTYVYVAPDIAVDILFYRGHWYRPHEGHWFSAPSYNGPWAHIPPAKVPGVILNLPPGYRRLPPGYQRFPYEHVRANWERWEREKHWQKEKEWRGGGREVREEFRGGREGRGGYGR